MQAYQTIKVVGDYVIISRNNGGSGKLEIWHSIEYCHVFKGTADTIADAIDKIEMLKNFK